MEATLTADSANPGLPLVICPATGHANAPLPKMVGMPVQPAAAAFAVLPIVIPIAHLLASFAEAALPLVPEDATPAHALSPRGR